MTTGNEAAEIEAIMDRLRAELEITSASAAQTSDEPLGPLPSRRRAEKLRGVTAERPYLARAGAWGRVRGVLLTPSKAVLRRLMRWYVEPLATDQRQFNAVALRLVDELHEQVLRLDRRVRELEDRQK